MLTFEFAIQLFFLFLLLFHDSIPVLSVVPFSLVAALTFIVNFYYFYNE